MTQPYSLQALDRLESADTLFSEDPPDGPYPDSTMSMWHAGLQQWMTPEDWILNSPPLAKGSMPALLSEDDDPPDFVQPTKAVVKAPVPSRRKKKDDRTTSMFDMSNDAVNL